MTLMTKRECQELEKRLNEIGDGRLAAKLLTLEGFLRWGERLPLFPAHWKQRESILELVGGLGQKGE